MTATSLKSNCSDKLSLLENFYTTGATSGAGTAYPPGAPEHISGFSEVRVTKS